MDIFHLFRCLHILLKILFNPASEGISISGALVYFTIPMPIQNLPITESQVNSALVIITIFFLCLYFTHGITVKAELRRQHIAEWIVKQTQSLVKTNMSDYFSGFAPFVAAIMGLSALKEPCEVRLVTDSKYVADGIEKGWAESWRKNGWRKADKKPALNPDLWEVLLSLTQKHEVHYHWVKGHATNPKNNRCDELAVSESRKFR